MIRVQSNELEKELEIRRDMVGRELPNSLNAIEPFWMEKRPCPDCLFVTKSRALLSL